MLLRPNFFLRITVGCVLAIAIIYVIHLTLGSFATSVAFALLGIAGSWIIKGFEQAQAVRGAKIIPWAPESWLGVALVSIILFQVVELALRVWLIPFRIVYGGSFYSSRAAIIGAILIEWLSFVLCGILIGYLTPTRAISAAIIGASIFLGMNITEAYTGAANYSNFLFLASNMGLDPDLEGFEFYRVGLITGLIVRGLVVVVVARATARRRILRGLVYK